MADFVSIQSHPFSPCWLTNKLILTICHFYKNRGFGGLTEQKRIVAKIEEIFSALDKLQKLFDENANIKAQLKKKILQYAIEGKLVEQRPEEGTGQDLFN